jgi:phytoene dehydrogenase-like protein
MRTYLRVKLAFLPALLFGLLVATGYPSLALDVGALVGVVTTLWALSDGRVRPMELALAGTFLVLAVAARLGLTVTTHAVAVTLVVQGLVGLAMWARGKAWTEPYAARDYGSAARTQAFATINRGLSLMWSVLFLVLAAIGFSEVSGWFNWGIVALGAVVSIYGPKLAVRWYLKRILHRRETFHWPAPVLGGATGDRFDVAVIGAGIGGLTAAAFLADAGLKVLVVERHTVPGGFCSHWQRRAEKDGRDYLFRFDGGAHDISGAHPGGALDGLTRRFQLDLDWRPVHQTAWRDGRLQPVPRGAEAIDDLCRRFPASRDEILAFDAAQKEIFAAMSDGSDTRGGIPFLPDTPEALMDFTRRHPLAAAWLERPFADFVAAYIRDPEARQAFSRLGAYTSDRKADLKVVNMVPMLTYSLNGGRYPAGGSGRLAEELVSAIELRGGTVRLGAGVAGINVTEGHVAGLRLEDGEHIAAGAVISNADLIRTVRDLIPADALAADVRAGLVGREPANSAVMLHLGLDIEPGLPPLVFGLKDGAGRGVGLASPSAVDRSAAPRGGGTIEVMGLMSHDEARAWFGGETDPNVIRHTPAYTQAKAALTERLIAAVEPLVPNLRDHIVYAAAVTPVTFARYCGTEDGSVYGLAVPDRFKGVRGPLPGLYFVGAANIGPGIEAAAISGARVAEALVPGVLDWRPKQPAALAA